MTQEELKNYKKQIQSLKKDFHKDNLDNVESREISDKEIIENKINSKNENQKLDKNTAESSASNIQEVNSNRHIFLKIIVVFLLLIIFCLLALKFINNNRANTTSLNEQNFKEKIYSDSIEKGLNTTVIENTPNIDSIFSIKSNNPTGYYAIIGSYGDLKNADKLKNNQKTSFNSYVFEGNSFRIGLKLSEDARSVFNDLKDVKQSYPDAWLLYSKN